MQQALTNERGYTGWQSTALVLLRMFIGWHFLYEGLAKILNPYWSSAGYLAGSHWWFSGWFENIAASPTTLTIVDYVNEWGLLIVGLLLMLGLFTRWAIIGGMAFLFLYYIAAPPFVGYTYSAPAEGAYIVVNKVLIELAALGVLLVFPTSREWGLDKFLPGKRSAAHASQANA